MALVPAAVLAFTLGAMLATLLVLVAPAYSQVVPEDLAADEDGNLVGPRPPDYEVDENGLLVIGGDVRMPCSQIGGPSGSPGAGTNAPAVQVKLERARIEQVRACRAAGYDTAGEPSAGASPGSSAAEQLLPETGGPVFPAALLPSAAVLLSAGGLLALRAKR